MSIFCVWMFSLKLLEALLLLDAKFSSGPPSLKISVSPVNSLGEKMNAGLQLGTWATQSPGQSSTACGQRNMVITHMFHSHTDKRH